MSESSLNAALRQFEAVEANLIKTERVLAAIDEAVPDGIAFMGNDPAYEDNCRAFYLLLESLPAIDGWKPEIQLMDLDDIAQSRLDAQDIGEVDLLVSVEKEIREPSRLLREYRARFNSKRRALVRSAVWEQVDAIELAITELAALRIEEAPLNEAVHSPLFDKVADYLAQIDTLMGSSMARPQRWHDLQRHLRFGLQCDLRDILLDDWPTVRAGLRESLYGDKEPVPLDVGDLGALVGAGPSGPVATRLLWSKLTEDDFERLVYVLISSESAYENPGWLMSPNAPDRGRDLSAFRLHSDPLGGVLRQRVILQCRHWLSRSVGPSDIAALVAKMKLWEPPQVDVLVVATSGRFTADCVAFVEKHNQSDTALRIEMWPDSHLERLLASRPALIAEFALR